MRKTALFVLTLLFFLITAHITYAQYLCGSTGLVYSDQNFCNSSCGATCQSLVSQTTGTSYACPSSGYEGFVYNPSTGYTYAVTTNTGFWTSFNQANNDPSLVIIPDATTNQTLASMLSYYSISQAWIGAYDSSMSTSYNTVDLQNYIWWNNSAINYSNWASGQPDNLLNSNDIGVVPTEGNHWAYMSSNGQWLADGYHYNYPSSQNYAPYYNALVQWNGPLSCVNGVAPASSPITNPDITNTINQYCNGQTPCYMCTDTSQCTPQNECPTGYTYNSTNNDCESPASCPAGGTLNSSSGSCTASLLSVACPNNYTYNSTNNDCEASATTGCNSGGTYNSSTGQCTLSPNNGCPAGYNYNSTNNDCEAYPSPQCNTGSAELINGQNQCVASPSYSCPDSQYSYNTLVINQCAAQANIQCPTGGSFSGGQCVSTQSPCPTGYTLHGGLCTAQATITCPGSGTYSSTYGVCTESSQTNCPSGFTYSSSNSLCLAPISQYVCPGSGTYDPSKGMCTTPVQQTCVTGYTLSNGQCVAPGVNSCPLPGTYNSTEGMCSATPNSYNCPTGYTYSNGACVASSACASPGSYNVAEQACSAPLQPCSPTSNNMQACTQTSSGWLCPLGSSVCTPNSSGNDFTNTSSITPTAYPYTNAISTVGSNNINNGYMSFYNYQANLPAGTYTLNFGADDNGWLFINGTQVGTANGITPTALSYTSNGGLTNFFIAVMNNYPNNGPSTTGTVLSVVNSSGQTVLTTSTSWSANLSPQAYGYNATCPNGYTYNASENACVAAVNMNCPNGYNYDKTSGQCTYTPAQGVCTSSQVQTTDYQCPTTGNIYSDLTTCNNNCIQTAACNQTYTQCTVKACPSTGSCQTSTFSPNTNPYTKPWYFSLDSSCNIHVENDGPFAGSCGTVYFEWLSPTNGGVIPPGQSGNAYYEYGRDFYGLCFSGSLNYTEYNQSTPAGYSCPLGNYACYGNPASCTKGQTCVTNTTTTTNWVCSLNNTSYSTESDCTASCIGSCPSGGTYNSSTGQCTAPATPVCPAGGVYDPTTKSCYAAPNITFGLQCPLGSYQCMPNGQGGYSCSTLTCQDVDTGVQQVPINQNNNPTNNGSVTDKGCLGTIYIFNGRTYDCREAGVETGFSNCCSSSKDWLGLGKCWQNEQELQQKKAAGFCHYTGTFCSAKFLGICLQKVEAYCCFNGVLARIIQEQGRYQGLPESGWGPSDDPHCEGFTPTQFQALDWSKIDLSEYYAYIQQTFMPNIQNNIKNGVSHAVNKLQQGYSGQ